MQQNDWMDFLVMEKKMYSKLCEVMNLTEQLAGAVDRQDQVSVQMLVAMRQEPVEQLRQAEERMREKRAGLSSKDLDQLEQVQAGGGENGGYGQMMADQQATNRRLLTRVIELDRRVSLKLCGNDSCYAEKGK